jgi:hypothetical protein
VRIATGKLVSSVLFVLVCLPCASQQKPDSAKPDVDAIAEARSIAEQGFAIAQKEFPGTTGAADELGRICSRLGDFPCALRADELALAIERKVGGNDNPDLVVSLTDLGQLKLRMGDFKGCVQAG